MIDKLSLEEIKQLGLLQSLETIKAYLALCEKLKNDLIEGDETTQQVAAIATRVLHLFITEDYGFLAWSEALRNECDKALMKMKESASHLH